MLKIFIPLFVFLPLTVLSQDPRAFNHGTCIVKFTENDSIKYYLTWSSAGNDEWEHDIFNSVICFDNTGKLKVLSPDRIFQGNGHDEAQEPVNATINSKNNFILSVWEDGNDTDAPNVRGEIHKPDGTVIVNNRIIAGGTGAQHSANAAHLNDKYLVFYADEAPPASGGAVVKAKILNNITGTITQTLVFTPYDEDHWWPVSASNSSNTRTLVVWGNDGYAARGTVLHEKNGVILQAAEPEDYLPDIQQYYYQTVWLDKISKFVLIARKGAYENITDKSMVCLIDTLGNMTDSITVKGGIVREAKMAARWSDFNQCYYIFYPSGSNDLTEIEVRKSGIISSASNQITALPALDEISWTSTGIWSTFVSDINGNFLFGDHYKVLFVMNDSLSNHIVKIPVDLDTSLFRHPLSVNINKTQPILVFPNPVSSSLNVYTQKDLVEVIIYASGGPSLKKLTGANLNRIDFKDYPAGVYFIVFKFGSNGIFHSKTIKIVKY